MKANSNFKLNKSFKRIIDRVVDSHERGELRRILINAQLTSMMQPKSSRKKDNQETQSQD